jgi:hypothetical protein
MKKNLLFFILILILLIPLPAKAGVGIVYGVRNVQVSEGEEKCINYGVYNPFSEDVTARIFASGEIAPLIDKEETFFVPGGTMHNEAERVDFCFRIPTTVYEKDCVIGSIFCEKTCSENPKTFEGSVVVQEVKDKKGGTGSSTVSSTSAKLNLIVSCKPEKRNYFALTGFFGSIAAVLIVAGYLVWTRLPSYRRLKEIRYKHALERLQKMKKELHETSHHTTKHTKKKTSSRKKSKK